MSREAQPPAPCADPPMLELKRDGSTFCTLPVQMQDAALMRPQRTAVVTLGKATDDPANQVGAPLPPVICTLRNTRATMYA